MFFLPLPEYCDYKVAEVLSHYSLKMYLCALHKILYSQWHRSENKWNLKITRNQTFDKDYVLFCSVESVHDIDTGTISKAQ